MKKSEKSNSLRTNFSDSIFKNEDKKYDLSMVNKYEENSGGGVDLENLLKTLYKIKKKKVFTDGYFKASIKENHIIYAEMEDKESRIIGIFEIDKHKGNIEPDIEDGFYKNLIDGKEYEVRSGMLTFTVSPIIFEILPKVSSGSSFLFGITAWIFSSGYSSMFEEVYIPP